MPSGRLGGGCPWDGAPTPLLSLVGIVNGQRRSFKINLTEFENTFPGFGEFLYEPDWLNMEDAERAVTFFYHLALCALNTSLVSGAMAERFPFQFSF